MLTQDDLKAIEKLLKPIRDDLEVVKKHNLRIEMNLIGLKEEFTKNLFNWKSELFTKIDSILGRLTKAELENVAYKAKQPLEKRIKRVESFLNLTSESS